MEWNGKKLNIIDCPGSDDFVGAAMTALNVTDTAILLLNGQYGPEVEMCIRDRLYPATVRRRFTYLFSIQLILQWAS